MNVVVLLIVIIKFFGIKDASVYVGITGNS